MVFRATAAEQKLEQAGLEPKAARAVTEVLEDMHGSLTSTLVTKDHLDSKLSELRADIRSEMSAQETRLVRWIVGMGGAVLIAVVIMLLRELVLR